MCRDGTWVMAIILLTAPDSVARAWWLGASKSLSPTQRFDLGQDIWQCSKHLLIAESYDVEPPTGQRLIARHIVIALGLMHGPIDFDNQCCRMAEKVSDEAVDHLLTAKMPPAEAVGAQAFP